MNKKGFTLVELLAALAVLLAALSAASFLYRTACRSQTRTANLARALYEARSKMAAAGALPAAAELETIMIEVPPVKLFSLRSNK